MLTKKNKAGYTAQDALSMHIFHLRKKNTGRTDRRTDGRMDMTSYTCRDATAHLKIPMFLLLNLNGDVRFVPLKSAYDSIKRAVTEIEAECSVETSFVTNMDLRVEIKIL